ncbi:HNH endonuclease [Thermoactinomyces sp. DSM 45892]|uniref:HNH endonuclease signature motif containing protein n=1 Tax=Thermoactinomyces sp. DSM 45892 TaxID=1882753 RepID=UPI00089A2425|nr:HNH endonuclease [Thermoactinomyces sp. DSM 45892]SDY86191.1 5-methylcytosine-specific restriction enzyme A [Thermoactinomyces sp. DSM 45892]
MALKPLRPCNKPYCNELTRDRYCEHHMTELTRSDRERETAGKRGYNRRWRKAREYHLSMFPVCVVCGRSATVVDHIKAHKGNHSLFWEPNNWQSMCASCHQAKTNREDGGYGNILKPPRS